MYCSFETMYFGNEEDQRSITMTRNGENTNLVDVEYEF